MSCAKTINPKCVISRSEALKLAPDLVKYTEADSSFNPLFEKVNDAQNSVKRGQKCVIAFADWKDPSKCVYALVKVTSVNSDCFQAIDGPVIRVTDGKVSWRTDGSDFIAPVK